jgi:cysteine desulfurase
VADDFIYLDYNATTPIAPRVAEAMRPFLTGGWGNPSSAHRAGREARAAVDRGRDQVAALLGAHPNEVVFTSGGSESNNLAIRGVLKPGDHVITSTVEHPAVLEVVRALEREGVALTVVPVDSNGRVDPNAVVSALRDDTRLVTIMLANNEVGTLQPIREITAACHERGVLVHTDAAQAVGKIPVNVSDLGVDLLTVAGHKLYAPKGVGALYVAAGVELVPLIRGANHERGLRAGTENVLEIVGLGEACAIAGAELDTELPRLRQLRDRLTTALRNEHEDTRVHAESTDRLPNTASLALAGVDANKLLAHLSELVAASAGAACHSDGVQSSHVLAAMGVSPSVAATTLRLSVGRFTTEDEVDRASAQILEAARA